MQTGGPRLLLRKMRNVMDERISSQARLDKIVQLIAANMVAEVCSIYFIKDGGWLELYATEGLNKDAVHRTRLKMGEGIIGDVAQHGRALNLSDAPSHPSFSYRPETGEDPYQSMLGVPISRGGRMLGVVAVQNRTHRHYDEEEVEALHTIAMVLAEMVAGGELVDEAELKTVELAPHKPERLKGTKFADGLAHGRAVLHEVPVAPSKLLSDDVAAEEKRLRDAIAALQIQLDEMLDGQHGLVGASYEVLETYRMFAHDRGWNRSLEEIGRAHV